ncbi:MAG TPA: Eco57I restriction-modification methylase domain-containing protein [Candidatus Syntrophosphaera sp.]|jgi:hypothetical protein|nr:Eco57I restriction-modification methylase domain-containing protein [Candidatus Syntrophosphaera sp.]HQC47318.1 Eco57I restriction-modification methylase domain-containing protein [Candidatus Syntrophosphaera sp.]HQO67976.1 Eco57I restriction-modification methylase domain-containing protein [Candidatus Syntrophosphaera sp.]
MEINPNIVTPANFSQEKWIAYFDTFSDVFSEKRIKMPRYVDDDFPSAYTLGTLEFDDGTVCGLFLLQAGRSLTERSSRKKQFDKATGIIKQENTQAGIFIFHDEFHSFRLSLVYPVYKGTKRAFSNYRRHSFYVSGELPNKTYIQQLSKHKLNSMGDLKDIFSVEKVSALFYEEFEQEYARLKTGIKHLFGQDVSDGLKGNFALLFVIRIIFLGFVQKKGWLGGNANFIRDYLNSYDPAIHNQGIYQDLLTPLFFSALNSAPSQKNKYGFPRIPEPFKTHLVTAPYLNGGLFRSHEDYDTEALFITDKAIIDFVAFLFSFNFTLEENTLYDEELELNPEFLGIIFEKLINKEHGAIYTPRLEVDFMCRLSLVKYLQQNCLESISLENLYKLFFPEYGNDGEQTPGDFTDAEAMDLLDKLETVTVCDPAIGSGAFAVGMLNVIDETECSIYRHFLPDKPVSSPYERKKRIIFQSLYGVEVKQWAVWITQLRLWITLLIEADDSLKRSEEPLLPSFDFKVRQGDSLIQMLGSTLFPVSGEGMIAADTQRKISDLVKLKTDYFNNKSPLQQHEIELKHKALYTDILDKKKKELVRKLYKLKNVATPEVQGSIFETDIQAEIDFASRQQKRQIEELELQIRKVDDEISQISIKNLPFVWRIDFPEIFIEKGGFDIVIGNPPYVAQEEIEDPLGTIKDNKRYKELLRQMANQDFPQDIPIGVINGKSDLYTFFYIRGLRLLNDKGILTFICSNSWLDTKYGAWLQAFLIKNCMIYFIIDNQAKRSFKSVDINSIITTIGAPKIHFHDMHHAKFVVFKLPFDECIYFENLVLIDGVTEVVNYSDIKVTPISHKQLWIDGQGSVVTRGETLAVNTDNYVGYKWGGYYLRAPKVYFDILSKARSNLMPLKTCAKVSFGLKTGANEFFYLTESQINNHKIEDDYIKPIIRTPKELVSLSMNNFAPHYYVFICNDNEINSIKPGAREYIKKGEKAEVIIKQGTKKGTRIIGYHNLESVKGNNPWWSLGAREIGDYIWFMTYRNRFLVAQNKGFIVDNRMYDMYCSSNIGILCNSAFVLLQLELLGRNYGGGGGPVDLKIYEVERVLIPRIDDPKLYGLFSELSDNKVREISFEFSGKNTARWNFDKYILSKMGIPDYMQKELYEEIVRLVDDRLNKAIST